jgi:hypothetical protein
MPPAIAPLRLGLHVEGALDRQWRGLIECVAVGDRALNGEKVRQCFRNRPPR